MPDFPNANFRLIFLISTDACSIFSSFLYNCFTTWKLVITRSKHPFFGSNWFLTQVLRRIIWFRHRHFRQNLRLLSTLLNYRYHQDYVPMKFGIFVQYISSFKTTLLYLTFWIKPSKELSSMKNPEPINSLVSFFKPINSLVSFFKPILTTPWIQFWIRLYQMVSFDAAWLMWLM